MTDRISRKSTRKDSKTRKPGEPEGKSVTKLNLRPPHPLHALQTICDLKPLNQREIAPLQSAVAPTCNNVKRIVRSAEVPCSLTDGTEGLSAVDS